MVARGHHFGALPKVVEVLPEHDRPVLHAVVQRVENPGGLEHPQCLRGCRPRAAQQVDRAVDREDRVLRQQLEEAQADHRGVVASEQPITALSDDRVETAGGRHRLIGDDRDALQEEREPALPVAVRSDRAESAVVLLAVGLQEAP